MAPEHTWPVSTGARCGRWSVAEDKLAYSCAVSLVAEEGVDVGRDQDAGDAGPHLQVGAASWPLRPPSLLAPRRAHSLHTHCTRGPGPVAAQKQSLLGCAQCAQG